ncbi:MAG: serine/threonine protein kinase, partial [Deltaproteobacteria bacterium]|nr:serine/threonine protein kinase [Deltaproteobacteria bacterium]
MRKICLRCGSKFGSRAEYCPHDGSLLVTDDEIADPLLGTVLLEQFRIEEQIGTGGMGTVYRAHQTTVGRDVAIKVLRLELARDEQAVFRFEREARVAISLDHPNLVRVFLSGRLADGRLYIVMELLEGRSLADELDEEGWPSLERALIMIMKLCAGLGAVHAAGIVHRDIKPENVYLVRRGRDADFVKLVDFGIARVLQAEGFGPTTTQSGRVFGTATYISPEAATGEETDQRSDIYSLGVLTYQLLTGELPFEGKTAGAVLMQHVHQEPPLLQSKGRGAQVPDDVARVVMRSLSKDPEARQQSLAEFLDALAEAADNAGLLNDARALLFGTVWGDELASPGSYLAELLGSSAPPSSPSPLADTQPIAVDRTPDDEALLSSAPKPFGTTSHDLATATRPKQRNHKWLWASLGLLGLIMVAVVTSALWLQRAPRATAEEPQAMPAQPPVAEPDAQVADIGTDAPVVEPVVVEEVVTEEPVVEEKAPPKPKAKKKPRKRRPVAGTGATAAVPETAAEMVAVPETAAQSGGEVGDESGAGTEKETSPESDDGIDWTVPDFPREPPPPTGTPDAPAR